MTGLPMVFGLETEFGISMLGDDPDNPIHPMYISHHVLQAWLDFTAAARGGWDFSTESPLEDARGIRLERGGAHPDMLTDVDRGLVNTILPNGARLYVDHAHPEYSGPEVTTARDAALWDRAGDDIMARAGQVAQQRLGHPIRLYKNNTDGKGVSYGTHENYLLPREVAFHRVVVQFTPFLVTRQIMTGAGRVGIGHSGHTPGFQISQRADFFEREVGLETTMLRPIINTRDEPHAEVDVWRRLHVITGDANSSQYATWLKVGTAALALRVIADGTLGRSRGESLVLADPVAAMHQVSHDLTCTETLALADGRRLSALDYQELWHEAAAQHWRERPEVYGGEAAYAEAEELLCAWAEVLADLRADPMRVADRLDWVAKWRLLETYRSRDQLAWDAPKLALIDLQYADVDPARGLQRRLEARGQMRTVVDPHEVNDAMANPPTATRAWFRGAVMAKFGADVLAASWDSLIVQLGDGRARRLELARPHRGTRALAAELVARCATVDELFAELGG